MLNINKVLLSNFKSHDNSSFEFNPRLNSIVGANGSGKSSIVDAIGLALFNTSFISMKDLITYGEDTANITIEFSYNGRDFTISRTIGKVSKVDLSSCDGEVSLQSNKEVYSYLNSLFDLDDLSHIYKNVMCVNSTNIVSLFLLEPAKRKSVFDSVFGLDRYEKVWKNLRVPESQLEKSIQIHSNMSDNLNRDLERYKKYESIIEDSIKELLKLMELQEQYELNKNLIQQKESLKQQRAELNRVIGGIERRISDLDNRISKSKVNSCPVCGQEMNKDIHEKLMSDLSIEKDSLLQELKSNVLKLEELRIKDTDIPVGSYTDYTREIAKLEGVIEMYKNELSKSDECLEKMSTESKIIEKLENKLAFLTYVRNGVKTIPELLVDRLCNNISIYASEILSDIMDEVVNVTMSKTYSITVSKGKEILDFSQLSDGQKVMTAIAVRLGIIKSIATNLSVAILDEPTVNLDKNHRERLAGNISKLKFNQLVVITHDDSFNDGHVILI